MGHWSTKQERNKRKIHEGGKSKYTKYSEVEDIN